MINAFSWLPLVKNCPPWAQHIALYVFAQVILLALVLAYFGIWPYTPAAPSTAQQGRTIDLSPVMAQCAVVPIKTSRKPEAFVSEWVRALIRMQAERNQYDLVTLVKTHGARWRGLTAAEQIDEARFTLACLQAATYIEVTDTGRKQTYWGESIANADIRFRPDWFKLIGQK